MIIKFVTIRSFIIPRRSRIYFLDSSLITARSDDNNDECEFYRLANSSKTTSNGTPGRAGWQASTAANTGDLRGSLSPIRLDAK